MDTFTLPSNSLRPLLLQRMQYMSARSHAWRRRLGRGLHSRWLIDRLDKSRTSTIAQLFFEDMQREFETFRAHLPATAEHVLDIGCGMAGIDAVINRHYTNTPHFTLIDRDTFADKVTYGFSATPCAYHSFTQTREFLRQNGLPDSQLTCIDIDSSGFPSKQRFDLVISLLSWGYHYPVSTYLEAVKAALTPEGRLILDIVDGSDGIELLNQHFQHVEPILQNTQTKQTYQRVIVHSPQ